MTHKAWYIHQDMKSTVDVAVDNNAHVMYGKLFSKNYGNQ